MATSIRMWLPLFALYTAVCVYAGIHDDGASKDEPTQRTNTNTINTEPPPDAKQEVKPRLPRVNLTIGLQLVLDLPAFKLWSDRTDYLIKNKQWTSELNVTTRITDLYTLHVKGVNERYHRVYDNDFSVNVTLTGIYIAQTIRHRVTYFGHVYIWQTEAQSDHQSCYWPRSADQQPWVRMKNTDYSRINVSASVQAFLSWTSGRYKNSSVDHFIWITGYNLGPVKILGYNESICTNKSVSVIEEDLDFIVQARIAHRIGRSLGLTLDDEHNNCDDEGYVLSPQIQPLNSQNDNLWKFSHCSESELEDFAESLSSSCLRDNCNRSCNSLMTNFTLPGFYLSLDLQCEFVKGPNFSYSRCMFHGDSNQRYFENCYAVSCCDVHMQEYHIIPMEGTQCDTDKYCLFGECVDAPGNQYCLNGACTHTGCPSDKRAYCDEIENWQCYIPEVRLDCCQTCQPHEGHKQGCEFGDHRAGCNTTDGKDCYQQNHRNECCRTCEDFYTGINGCEYGDRDPNCEQDKCGMYTQQKRTVSCCDTCGTSSPPPTGTHTVPPAPTAGTGATPSTSTWTVSHTTWTEQPATGSSTWSSSSSTTLAARKGNNTGVAVGVSVSVVFVVVVVIIAVICWRRKRNSEPKHLSPITDVMYNEYKLSKRAPLPEPRDISKSKTGSKQKLVRQDSEVYAYINPDDVEHIPAKTDQQNGLKKQPRNEDDPLPPTPGDYLELKVVDKYGYMEPVEKNKNKPNPYSEPYSDNATTGYVNANGIPEYKKISSVRAGQDTSHHKF